MTERMTRAQLIDTLKSERSKWDGLIARVVANDQTDVSLWQDGWTVRDLVGHITYYERWVLNWLEAAVRGQLTVATHRDLLSVDERNAVAREENRNRSMPELLADGHAVFERLVLVVQLLDDSDLNDANRFERYIRPFWQDGRTLWQCLAGDSYAHYEEHIADIERLVAANAATVRAPVAVP